MAGDRRADHEVDESTVDLDLALAEQPQRLFGHSPPALRRLLHAIEVLLALQKPRHAREQVLALVELGRRLFPFDRLLQAAFGAQ